MPQVVIRPERPEEYAESEAVVREAFWNVYAPGCTEHYLLHKMRSSPCYVPELSMVALDGGVVGHIAYTRSLVISPMGRRIPTLTMGPLAVRPDRQGRGVGRRLIEESRRRAAEMGFRGILLCGDPDYYVRCGFVPAEHFGIYNADGMYSVALMACELYKGGLYGARGRYVEDMVFIVNTKEAEEFDLRFPPRERIEGTPTQLRLEKLAAMRWPAL